MIILLAAMLPFLTVIFVILLHYDKMIIGLKIVEKKMYFKIRTGWRIHSAGVEFTKIVATILRTFLMQGCLNYKKVS